MLWVQKQWEYTLITYLYTDLLNTTFLCCRMTNFQSNKMRHARIEISSFHWVSKRACQRADANMAYWPLRQILWIFHAIWNVHSILMDRLACKSMSDTMACQYIQTHTKYGSECRKCGLCQWQNDDWYDLGFCRHEQWAFGLQYHVAIASCFISQIFYIALNSHRCLKHFLESIQQCWCQQTVGNSCGTIMCVS